MLKANIIEILSRDSSDMHRIERLANELEKLFVEEMIDSVVSVLVKLYTPEEENDANKDNTD